AERFEHRELDALPDRVLLPEIARDEHLVDDGDLARVVDFRGGERAAPGQAKAERLEVAFAAQLENRARLFRVRLPRDLDVSADTAIRRQRRGFSGDHDTRQRVDPIEKSPEEPLLLRRGGVLTAWQRHARHQYLVG